jgi:hypothetical protein
VTVSFAGDDDRQPFPLNIQGDGVGEGNETIVLRITSTGELAGVRQGSVNTTIITIIEDDCELKAQQSYMV